jgi:hypothetical protein
MHHYVQTNKNSTVVHPFVIASPSLQRIACVIHRNPQRIPHESAPHANLNGSLIQRGKKQIPLLHLDQ